MMFTKRHVLNVSVGKIAGVILSTLLLSAGGALGLTREPNTTINVPLEPQSGTYGLENAFGSLTFNRPLAVVSPPDETKLYVVDTGIANPKTITVFDVTSSNTLSGGTTFATGNSYDGIKCDVDGRVWAGDGTGVAIYAPDGYLIGKILFHRVANLCFGGPHYKTLYMVGQPIVTSIPVLVPGRPAIKKLSLGASGNQINLTWPAPSTGFLLEENEQVDAVTNWNPTPLKRPS